MLPVKMLELGGVLGVAVVNFIEFLISFSLPEDDVPGRVDVDEDQDCPVQKGSAAESS